MINIKKITLAITPAMAIMIALLFMIMPAAGAVQAQPAVASTVQPNIALNTQATWTSFNSSMAYNEYLNGTNGINYLNVENGTGNYISVNAKDIQAKALSNDKLPNGLYANSSSAYSVGYLEGPQGGAVFSSIGSNPVSVSLNESNAAAQGSTGTGTGIGTMINVNNLSSNPNFDYITAQYSFTGPAAVNAYAQMEIFNTTTSSTSSNIGASNAATELHPGQSGYFSFNLASLNRTSSFLTNSKDIYIMFNFYLPTGSSTYTITINGLAVTTYPITLGMNSTGAAVAQGIGNIHLSVFKPAVPMTIDSNGYSENLTQPLDITTNYRETKTPLSGNYIEQVEYTGTVGNMSAPGLAFTGANITINQDIPAKQIQVLEINGISYSNSMNTTGSNKTIMLTVANPASSYTVIDITDYTSTQWQSISSPAGFFQNPTAWVEGGIFSALIVVVVFLGFKGLGKTLKGDKANEENHARILNGKKGR